MVKEKLKRFPSSVRVGRVRWFVSVPGDLARVSTHGAFRLEHTVTAEAMVFVASFLPSSLTLQVLAQVQTSVRPLHTRFSRAHVPAGRPCAGMATAMPRAQRSVLSVTVFSEDFTWSSFLSFCKWAISHFVGRDLRRVLCCHSQREAREDIIGITPPPYIASEWLASHEDGEAGREWRQVLETGGPRGPRSEWASVRASTCSHMKPWALVSPPPSPSRDRHRNFIKDR